MQDSSRVTLSIGVWTERLVLSLWSGGQEHAAQSGSTDGWVALGWSMHRREHMGGGAQMERLSLAVQHIVMLWSNTFCIQFVTISKFGWGIRV